MEKEVIGRRRICFFGGIDGRHGHSSKLFPSVLERIQSELDKGKSVYSIAKQEGVSEGSIRYWIKQGELKKKIVPVLVGSPTVSRSDRSAQDAQSGADMGIAVSRVEERALAATGAQSYAQTLFDPNESVENGGVLFSLSALISQGLDRLFTLFGKLSNGFYGLHHILILLCFMALCRIKNIEQLLSFAMGHPKLFSF